jgi:hypothetical protein
MNRIKLQHYVPRLYLKKFGVKSTPNNYMIYCFDKTSSCIFYTNIRNIAAENYFYDNRDKPVQFEIGFTKAESTFNKIYKKICKYEDISNLTPYERTIVSLYLAMQDLRTLELRQFMKSQYTQFYNVLLERGLELNPELKEEFEDALKEDSLKAMHLNIIRDSITDFAMIIYQMKWILLTNDFEVPLWTSDNPIARWNPNGLGIFGNLGYLSKGIQFHYPLTPKLSLIFCDSSEYKILPTINNMFHEDNVVFENYLQIVNSTKHLLSNNDDFQIAHEVLEKHPEYRDVNRKRVNVQ